MKTTKRDRDGLHRRPNRPDGIYYFYFRAPNGHWSERSTGTRNYSEAREIRARELEKIRNGQLPSELRHSTLQDASGLWLQQQKTRVRQVTMTGYRWILAPLLGRFGGKKLKDISVAAVRAYQAERALQVSHRTVNREIQTLTAVMRLAGTAAAMSEVKMLPNPASQIGRPLTSEEESRLWTTAASRPQWQAVSWIALLAANTGLRGGEIKRLRLGDLILDQQMLQVRRNGTKTSAGERLIPLNPVAAFAAEQLVKRGRTMGAYLPEHYLLPSDTTKYTKDPAGPIPGFDPHRHQASWRTAWRTMTQRAGLRGLRFHDLRHHFVTKLAEASVPVHIAMSLAGHMSPEMTRHYTHISDKLVREAVNVITSGRMLVRLESAGD